MCGIKATLVSFKRDEVYNCFPSLSKTKTVAQNSVKKQKPIYTDENVKNKGQNQID